MNSFNKHYKNEKDLKEDCLRKLSQIGFDIDKSFYNTHKADLLATEGPYGKIYNSRFKEHQSNKMLY